MNKSLSLFVVFSFLTLLSAGCNSKSDVSSQASNETKPKKAEKTTTKKVEKTKTKLSSVEIEALYQKANQALKSNKPSLCLNNLNQILNSDPENIKARKLRMNLFSRAGALKGALTDAAILIKQLPPEEGVKLHNIRGFIYLSQKNYSEAIKDFDAAIRIDSEFSTAYNNRGLAYISQSRYLKAIDDFNMAIQLNPEYVDAHNNRGFALLQNGSYRKALESFTRTLELEPNSLNAFSNRGSAHIKIGNLEEAVEDFTKAIEIAPYSVKHYLQRRSVHKMMKNDEGLKSDSNMIEWIQKLGVLNAQIKRSPKEIAYFVKRTKHFLKNNETNKALADIKKSLSLDPKCVEAITLRGHAHFLLSDYKSARKDCVEALKLQEENSKAHSLLGDICLIEKDYDKAIEHFHAGGRFDSSVAKAYFKRSEQLKKAGKDKEANKDLKIAIKLDPNITTVKR